MRTTADTKRKYKPDQTLITLRLMAAQISELNEKMEAAIDLLEASLDATISLSAEIAYDYDKSGSL